ncbi:hypothetical protein TURU_014738 [Turdus rufiventris]|nr:hypothetical protein TURU_014738 [Turdus rufiventris]
MQHVTEGVVQTLLKFGQAWCCDQFPGEPVPVLNSPLREKLFPDIQPKRPQTQLHAIQSSPIAGHESEEIIACLYPSPHEDVEDHNEVSPQCPVLQAGQTKGSQPLLKRFSRHIFCNPLGLPLGAL